MDVWLDGWMDGFSSNTIPPPVAASFSSRSLQISIIISEEEINSFWTQVLQLSVCVCRVYFAESVSMCEYTHCIFISTYLSTVHVCVCV